MSNPNAAPLTEEDVEQLSKYLDEVAVEKDGMSFEMLDGFLTAVLSSPRPIGQDEWLPRVWDGDGEAGALPPADDAQGQAATAIILKHYANLDAVLRQGGSEFNPWILEFEDEDGSIVSFGQEWALGYLRGIELAEEDWDELLSDPEWQDDFDAIDLLARGPDDEETGGELRDQKTRDDNIETMLGFALDAYDYWAEQRLKPATQRRESPKVGRNDPCPCGSGKKYKQCHGANIQ